MAYISKQKVNAITYKSFSKDKLIYYMVITVSIYLTIIIVLLCIVRKVQVVDPLETCALIVTVTSIILSVDTQHDIQLHRDASDTTLNGGHL